MPILNLLQNLRLSIFDFHTVEKVADTKKADPLSNEAEYLELCQVTSDGQIFETRLN